jgi:hypothetical protein
VGFGRVSTSPLWRENLDPNNPVMEGIIGALIYGIKFLEELKRMNVEADMVFASIGLKCKAWAYSGKPPPSVVTMEGGSVKVAG